MNWQNVYTYILIVSLICVLTALSTDINVIKHHSRRLSFYPYEIPKTTTSKQKLIIENSTNNMSSNNQRIVGLFIMLLIDYIILKYLNFYLFI